MSLAIGLAGARLRWGTRRTRCSVTRGAGIRSPASAPWPPAWSTGTLRGPTARPASPTSASWSGRRSDSGSALQRLGRAASGRRMILVTAAATWTVLGGRSLRREATTIAGPAGGG